MNRSPSTQSVLVLGFTGLLTLAAQAPARAQWPGPVDLVTQYVSTVAQAYDPTTQTPAQFAQNELLRNPTLRAPADVFVGAVAASEAISNVTQGRPLNAAPQQTTSQLSSGAGATTGGPSKSATEGRPLGTTAKGTPTKSNSEGRPLGTTAKGTPTRGNNANRYQGAAQYQQGRPQLLGDIRKSPNQGTHPQLLGDIQKSQNHAARPQMVGNNRKASNQASFRQTPGRGGQQPSHQTAHAQPSRSPRRH